MARVKVDKKVWAKLRKKLAEAGKSKVRVGVMADAGTNDDGISLVEIAAIHEFGSPNANIPERSFIRRTFKKMDKTRRVAEELARQIVANRITVEHALETLGAHGAASIKATITQGKSIPPPLKQATIDRKGGSTRALVDTGQLLGAITWVVE